LAVQASDRFKISVEHNGRLATGETIIPAPPQNVTLTPNEILIDTSTLFDTSSITVSWQGEDTFYSGIRQFIRLWPARLAQSERAGDEYPKRPGCVCGIQ
jgi:hypothetical protein